MRAVRRPSERAASDLSVLMRVQAPIFWLIYSLSFYFVSPKRATSGEINGLRA
jgi:hypothetical protein